MNDIHIVSTRRVNGIAGQYAYVVKYAYMEDEPVTLRDDQLFTSTFVGSVYGGRVVLVLSDGAQIRVDRAVMDRCGPTLDPGWIRAFYAPIHANSTV